MSEKVFKEYCEDCGCPLEVCCKPKEAVVSVGWLKKYCNKTNKEYFRKNWIYIPDFLSAIHKQSQVVRKK